MTNERPVEELIGWVRNTCRCSGGCLGWTTPDGTERDRAEVDDLAAWLNVTLEYDWDFGRDEDDDGYFVGAIWSTVNDGESPPDEGWSILIRHQPTIRDALVAAVRKVAAWEGSDVQAV